jgi:uncharacterized membrane protein YfcA
MGDGITIVLTLVAGFFTGVLSGMFGVGGAVISTPAILALGATNLEAVGSTLPSIIPSSISGSLRYLRDGLVHKRVALVTGLAGATSAALGAVLSDAFPGRGHVQMILTALLMGFTAYRLGLMAAPGRETDVPHELRTTVPLLVGIGLVAGLLSGFLGVGGGILMVPAFSGLVGLDLRRAIATSLVCVGMIAVPGTIAHQILGNVNWFYALPLMIGAIPGARVGAHLAIRASDRHLRIAVASVLGSIAVIYGAIEIVLLLTA